MESIIKRKFSCEKIIQTKIKRNYSSQLVFWFLSGLHVLCAIYMKQIFSVIIHIFSACECILFCYIAAHRLKMCIDKIICVK